MYQPSDHCLWTWPDRESQVPVMTAAIHTRNADHHTIVTGRARVTMACRQIDNFYIAVVLVGTITTRTLLR